MKKGKGAETTAAKKSIGLQRNTLHSIYGVALLVVAALLVFAALGKGGPVGTTTYGKLDELFGIGYFLLPLLAIVLSASFLQLLRPTVPVAKAIGSVLFFVSGLALASLASNHGGLIGSFIATPLVLLFDVSLSAVVLAGVLTISILLIFDVGFSFEKLHEWQENRREAKALREEMRAEREREESDALERSATVDARSPESERVENEVEPRIAPQATVRSAEAGLNPLSFISRKPFEAPPLSLLEKDKGKAGGGDIKAQANIIKRTLQNFGIDVEMDEVSIGPSITRFALKPAEGVKLSRIVALQNDLSLSLAAHPIRIEAPIPGKSLVGIEIPNSTKTTVGLASLLSAAEYQESPKPLLAALGKGISGKPQFGNIARMPHVLIAGATGSGKSVTIHALIVSLLFRNPPDALRFIMIDPKRVELTLYNKIPHLLTPVITDPKKAIMALKWATKEMERRYTILEAESVRDIESYHKNVLAPALEKAKKKPDDAAPPLETMPYIVVIIDELADIMQSYPRELEAGIVRLAQMSRAVGIHLVLSTQRPSVNVITGLIKANVPARIALQVASQIDSRTILDMSGAEKLLGAGDMLYLSGEMSQPVRLQSAFISEGEVKRVAKYLADSYADEIPSEINLGAAADPNAPSPNNPIFSDSLDSEDDIDDSLYQAAKSAVEEAGRASTSYLQRKLRIGYSRAARLMDVLEERGVIGPQDGSKPREVLNRSSETPAEVASVDEGL